MDFDDEPRAALDQHFDYGQHDITIVRPVLAPPLLSWAGADPLPLAPTLLLVHGGAVVAYAQARFSVAACGKFTIGTPQAHQPHKVVCAEAWNFMLTVCAQATVHTTELFCASPTVVVAVCVAPLDGSVLAAWAGALLDAIKPAAVLVMMEQPLVQLVGAVGMGDTPLLRRLTTSHDAGADAGADAAAILAVSADAPLLQPPNVVSGPTAARGWRVAGIGVCAHPVSDTSAVLNACQRRVVAATALLLFRDDAGSLRGLDAQCLQLLEPALCFCGAPADFALVKIAQKAIIQKAWATPARGGFIYT